MKPPKDFDGARFAEKYSLAKEDFHIDGNGDFQCPSLPNLKDNDLLDCLLGPPDENKERNEKREEAYKKAGVNVQAMIVALWEKEEGRPEAWNTLQEKRLLIKDEIK
jgi:hypothetical protein